MNEIESCSHQQQRILITGVSGLIGRILFDHLKVNYQVYGLDQHRNLSTRYQLQENNDDERQKGQTIISIPSERFFQCDITDRIKLHQIIEELHIDVIIHLAAILENHPDIEKISLVNIEGTKNVFEAPRVRRIIYASSVRTVFGYLTREPYLSICNETFDDVTMLKYLRKLTVRDDSPLPGEHTPGDTAYDQSKIIGEQMAMNIMKTNSKSIICARFGWVNISNEPGMTWLRTIWFSYRDLCSFMDKALQAPLHISGIYFAMSNNHRLWVDLEDAKRDLDYVPQDGAKNLVQ